MSEKTYPLAAPIRKTCDLFARNAGFQYGYEQARHDLKADLKAEGAL